MLITFWVLWTATCSLLVGSSGGGAERSSTSFVTRKLWLLQKYDGCASCLMKQLGWRSTLKLLFHYSLSWSWRSSWIQDFFLGDSDKPGRTVPPHVYRWPWQGPPQTPAVPLKSWHGIFFSPKLIYSWHLKIGQKPKKETIVFQPSIFRCYVSFRGGMNSFLLWLNIIDPRDGWIDDWKLQSPLRCAINKTVCHQISWL